MSKKTDTTKAEAKEFPITLEEFVGSIPSKNAEVKASFLSLMKQEKATGKKTREEWNLLLDLFRKQPTEMPWGDWLAHNKGGK